MNDMLAAVVGCLGYFWFLSLVVVGLQGLVRLIYKFTQHSSRTSKGKRKDDKPYRRKLLLNTAVSLLMLVLVAVVWILSEKSNYASSGLGILIQSVCVVTLLYQIVCLLLLMIYLFRSIKYVVIEMNKTKITETKIAVYPLSILLPPLVFGASFYYHSQILFWSSFFVLAYSLVKMVYLDFDPRDLLIKFEGNNHRTFGYSELAGVYISADKEIQLVDRNGTICFQVPLGLATENKILKIMAQFVRCKVKVQVSSKLESIYNLAIHQKLIKKNDTPLFSQPLPQTPPVQSLPQTSPTTIPNSGGRRRNIINSPTPTVMSNPINNSAEPVVNRKLDL